MIEIVAYRVGWPAEFAEIGRGVRRALGALALRVDHIGSTAVAGLAAKDVIDVQVTVAALGPAVEVGLNRVGFGRVWRIEEDHVPAGAERGEVREWEKWFFKRREGWRPVNLHLRVAGRANQRYALLFRDYLRANAAVAGAYGGIKVALARQCGENVDAYYEVKDPVCDVIKGGAEEWALRVAWGAGESDC